MNLVGIVVDKILNCSTYSKRGCVGTPPIMHVNIELVVDDIRKIITVEQNENNTVTITLHQNSWYGVDESTIDTILKDMEIYIKSLCTKVNTNLVGKNNTFVVGNDMVSLMDRVVKEILTCSNYHDKKYVVDWIDKRHERTRVDIGLVENESGRTIFIHVEHSSDKNCVTVSLGKIIVHIRDKSYITPLMQDLSKSIHQMDELVFKCGSMFMVKPINDMYSIADTHVTGAPISELHDITLRNLTLTEIEQITKILKG